MSKLFPNNNVTCMGPWYHFRVWSTGRAAPCDIFQDQFVVDRYDTWYQSGEAPTQTRQAIQQGCEPKGCRRCQDSERKNTISFRERFNLQAGIHQGPWFEESLKQSPAWDRMQQVQLTPTQKPYFVSATFNNDCSATCRMCIPRFSSAVGDLWKTLKIDQQDKDTAPFDFTAPSRNSWAHDEEKYQSLLNLVIDNPNLIYLKVNGGEPFGDPSVTRFLQDCVDNHATNCDLYITTNGTVYDESFIKLIKNFKGVMIDLSIEGFHPTNDYIRIGTSYQQVEQNILKFKQHCSERFEVKIHTLPQLLSVEHYHTAVDFCLEHNLPLYGNPLYMPKHYMMEILPQHHKQRLKQKFIKMYNLTDIERFDLIQQVNFNSTDLNQSTNGITPTVSNQLIKMIRLLDSGDQPDYEQYRYDFVRYTQMYDQHFGVSFLDYYPELEDFYNEYCKS